MDSGGRSGVYVACTAAILRVVRAAIHFQRMTAVCGVALRLAFWEGCRVSPDFRPAAGEPDSRAAVKHERVPVRPKEARTMHVILDNVLFSKVTVVRL